MVAPVYQGDCKYCGEWQSDHGTHEPNCYSRPPPKGFWERLGRWLHDPPNVNRWDQFGLSRPTRFARELPQKSTDTIGW